MKAWGWLTAAFSLIIGGVVFAQTDAPPVAPIAAASFGQQTIFSVLISAYMPRILEWLKTQDFFPFMRQGAAKANRAFAVLVSALQGAGLTWSYQSAAAGWSFSIGSTHSSFEEFVYAFALAFIAQQVFYDNLPSVRAEAVARGVAAALKGV